MFCMFLLGDDHSLVYEESRTCLQVCEGLHDGTGNMEWTGVTNHTVPCANGNGRHSLSLLPVAMDAICRTTIYSSLLPTQQQPPLVPVRKWSSSRGYCISITCTQRSLVFPEAKVFGPFPVLERRGLYWRRGVVLCAPSLKFSKGCMQVYSYVHTFTSTKYTL